MLAALPAYLRLLVLLAGLLAAAGLFFTLRFRDRRLERREVHRLRRLAEACSDLVRLRHAADVGLKVSRYAAAFVACRSAVYQCGSGPFGGAGHPHELVVPFRRQDGVCLGALVTVLRARPTIRDEATLAQLGGSAAAALETISLFEENADALRQATASRQQAEAARRDIEAILSAMSDAMLALDQSWRLMYLNPKAAGLLGRQAEDCLGHPIWTLLPFPSHSVFETELRRAASTGQDAAFRARWPAPPDTDATTAHPWVMVRVFPHREGVTVYLLDITRQVETEEQLRQTAKMDAIGQLTGGIAHDFNNLLTVILGNLELLEDILGDDPQVLEAVELARRSAQSASSLTHQLLAFARRQPLSPTNVDPGRLIDRLGALLRRTLGAPINVEIRREADLWTARVDPTQLENALLNLALNARDAMTGGGTLRIAVSNLRAMEAPAPGLLPGDYTQIEVADTGTGIDPAVLSKVFDPFFSTKSVGLGTGLGLSMVYGFAKQSGGQVAIASELGPGSTICLTLPRGEAVPDDAGRVRPAVRLPRGAGETILLVEDSALVRRYTEAGLRGLGYAIVAVSDGAGAQDALETGLMPDLLLTDMILSGGMNGKAVADEVRRSRPDLPVLFMSGYVDHGIVKGGTVDPGVTLLHKPFRRMDLAQAVYRHLHASDEDQLQHLHN